ncbi:uncharacterized protein LOC136007459 isoform X2 [Lathamus discolor]|uniref:uncharacterized protein LOC136007459 isoform X2 n=1 Tax=Lathamus discolor TaxID=678569 RepID=UPI0032B81718
MLVLVGLVLSLAPADSLNAFPPKFQVGKLNGDVVVKCSTAEQSVTWTQNGEPEPMAELVAEGRTLTILGLDLPAAGNYSCWAGGVLLDSIYVVARRGWTCPARPSPTAAPSAAPGPAPAPPCSAPASPSAMAPWGSGCPRPAAVAGSTPASWTPSSAPSPRSCGRCGCSWRGSRTPPTSASPATSSSATSCGPTRRRSWPCSGAGTISTSPGPPRPPGRSPGPTSPSSTGCSTSSPTAPRPTNTWRARRRRGCGTVLSGCASAAGTPTPAPPGAPGASGMGPGQPSSTGCERSEPTKGTPSPHTHPLPHCTSVCPGAWGHPRVAAASTQHRPPGLLEEGFCLY